MSLQCVLFDILEIAKNYTLEDALQPVPEDVKSKLNMDLHQTREFYKLGRIQMWVETYILKPFFIDEYRAEQRSSTRTSGGCKDALVVGSKHMYIFPDIGNVFVECEIVELSDKSVESCTISVKMPKVARGLYDALDHLKETLERGKYVVTDVLG